MKILIASIIALSSLSSFAATNLAGTYRAEKEIMVMSESKESCLESQGRWETEEEVCILSTADEAKVKKTSKGYTISISTIGSNYHTCEFEGSAKLVGKTLVSKVKAEAYDYEKDEIVKVICEVKADIKNGEMSVSTNQKCQSFCGANAWLDVDGLKKVK